MYDSIATMLAYSFVKPISNGEEITRSRVDHTSSIALALMMRSGHTKIKFSERSL